MLREVELAGGAARATATGTFPTRSENLPRESSSPVRPENETAMNTQTIVRCCCAAVLLCGLCKSETALANENDGLPDFDKVKNLVQWHFESRRDRSPGDILSRSNVEPILKQLLLIGWFIRDRKSILNRVPRDDAYLVRLLRTTAGKKFMHNVREYPMVYDRMDRLIGLAQGREVLQEMIRMPDGHKLMLKLTQKNDNDKTDPLLARVRVGPRFNKPTGRIYTVDYLLAALKKSHERSIGKSAAAAE